MSDYKLFDTFQDAVIVIDREGRLVYGNHTASVLFEVSARRMSSTKPLSQFVTFEPDPITVFGDLREISDATQVKEVNFTSSTGKTGSLQVSLQRQPAFFSPNEDEKERWLVYLRDVSLERILHEKYRGELDQKESVILDLRDAREKLENYSRNLEKMVEARTVELQEANRLLKTILDSLGQGILVFDREGKCLPVFSSVCHKLLEGSPKDRSIEDVLALTATDRSAFASWREAVFGEMLDFEDLLPLAPSNFKHSKSLEVALGYSAMRKPSGSVEGVVVIATDRTREVQALREAAIERETVRQVTQVARNKDAFQVFVRDARYLLSELQSEVAMDRHEIARQLHTLKGGALTFSLSALASGCHHLEETLNRAPDDAKALSAFRGLLAKEALSLQLGFNEATETLANLLGLKIAGSEREVVKEMGLVQLEKWVAILQKDESASARAVALEIMREMFEKPLGKTLAHYDASLADLAQTLGKELAPLIIEGGEVRAPLELMQPLLSSLVHAFRNSVDHGLEAPDVRVAAGKAAQGSIRVRFARQTGVGQDRLKIVISDDGNGVDPARIRTKLREKGLQSIASSADDEVIQAILRDDFSTSEQASEISGRGVGMAAIAEEAHKLGGHVHVRSTLGRGMSLEIDVPMPVADFQKGLHQAA
jgi:two-component system chemotaxis sensor kinase CheA